MREVGTKNGFTLVEIALVVVVIGLLNAMAIPALQEIRAKVRATILINDIRVFNGTFQRYVSEVGDWPPNYNAKKQRTPEGMEEYLPSKWGNQGRTPIGGIYFYEFGRKQKGAKISAVIRIRDLGQNKVQVKRADFLEFDKKNDDGDLTTGRFRLGRGNDLIWILNE